MKGLMLAGMLAFAPAAMAQTAPAADTGMAVIYKDALGPGWENWKWDGAESELSVELGGSPRRPIRVDAQGWKGLYLHHAPFSTAPFKALSFLVQSIGGTGEIRVLAIAGGKPVEGKQKIVKLAPGGWTKVDVPLATLGVENATIDGLWLQNNGNDPAPRFYVTEILLH